MDLLIPSLVFAVVFLVLLSVMAGRGSEAERRQTLARRMARPREDAPDVDITRKLRRHDEGTLLKFLFQLNLLRKLEENMWQAGIYVRISEMLLIMTFMFGAGLFLGQALWQDTPLSLCAGAGFATVPLAYIRWRRGRRLTAFNQQLPFALDLIKSSLEAGHSFSRGLQLVVQEFGDPLGSEFRTVIEQTRIGLPMPRALEELVKRVPEEDLHLLTVAVKVQSEVGSSLAGIVGRLAEIVRTRQRLRLQIRALTAQSRLGGLIVALLPLLVLGIFTLMEPSYAMTLFDDPAGLRIFKTAVVLDALAFLTIRRLLRVRY